MRDPEPLGGEYGFTLVEVIVVSSIVAGLSLCSVLLYIGYANDARKNTAEGLAAAAAGFLCNARNLNMQVPNDGIATPLTENGKWEITTSAGGVCVFRCPKGTVLEIDDKSKTVTASFVNHKTTSTPYEYDK